MSRTPSLGAGLVITNPMSSGYYAYLAAAEALTELCDEIVVVDGGSTDGSVEALLGWLDRKDVRVISDEVTHWGRDDGWHWGQICVNLNTALDALDTDWAYVFSADYVPDLRTAANLRRELDGLSDSLWVRTWRGKPINGQIVARMDRRNVVLNLRELRRRGIRAGFGLHTSGLFSDFPIRFERRAWFEDPESGVGKPLYAGEALADGGSLTSEFIAYGHFFYTREQVQRKIARWDRAVCRFCGTAPARLSELRLRHGVHSNRGYYTRDEVLGWDHPLQMRRVIEEFYEDGMVGGWKRRDSQARQLAVTSAIAALSAERKVRSLARPRRGHRDALVWSGIEEPAHG